MPVQRQQGCFQHQLGGAWGPLAFAFHGFQPLHEAADVQCDAGEFGAEGCEGAVDAEPCGNRRVGEVGDGAASAPDGCAEARFEAHGDLRLELATGEIGMQALAGRHGLAGEIGLARPHLQAFERGKRRFGKVAGDACGLPVDDNGGYAGMVIVADAYAPEIDQSGKTSVADLARNRDTMLMPFMNAREAAQTFQIAYAEELAVVDSLSSKKVLGLLTEQHLLRRYAEELDKARRDLTGEG